MTQKRFIYADNAATTKMSERAVEVMKKYLTDNYGNASQPYSFARSSKKVLNEAREIIASVIGAKPNEIFFTSGGTESDNWVLLNAWQHGLKIVTSQIEHHAVLNTCAFIGKHGGKVVYLPVTDSGIVSLSDVKNHVDENCLLSVMMVNNEIGSIQPMEEIAAIVKECGGLVHSDAVQAVGHIPINVDKNRIDMLSASAHKFNGPKGVGFLYSKKGIIVDPLIHGGSQEFGLRAGTENVAGIIAMATALQENIERMERNQRHLTSLENVLLESLSQSGIPFVRNGASQMPGLVSLSFKGQSGEALLHRLDLHGICVSTGSACDSKDTRISHVLKAIRLPEDYALGTIRVSFGIHNTIDDAVEIANILIKVS